MAAPGGLVFGQFLAGKFELLSDLLHQGLSFLVEWDLRGDILLDDGVDGRYLVGLVVLVDILEGAMEDSLEEVLNGGVEVVLHFQQFFLLVIILLVQRHLLDHFPHQLMLLLSGLLQLFEGVVPHVFACGDIDQVQRLLDAVYDRD